MTLASSRKCLLFRKRFLIIAPCKVLHNKYLRIMSLRMFVFYCRRSAWISTGGYGRYAMVFLIVFGNFSLLFAAASVQQLVLVWGFATVSAFKLRLPMFLIYTISDAYRLFFLYITYSEVISITFQPGHTFEQIIKNERTFVSMVKQNVIFSYGVFVSQILCCMKECLVFRFAFSSH